MPANNPVSTNHATIHLEMFYAAVPGNHRTDWEAATES
jgi:hypothetical protein